MRKSIIGFAIAAILCEGAFGAEIAFTNAKSDGDLANAENWTGEALPGADDVGVVDVATYGGAYTVGDDAALGGLKFTSASSAVTIGGEGTLALGAGGLTLDAAGGLTVTAPLATSSAQTWNFGSGTITFSNTISGTSDLTLKSATMVHFRAAPNYGGKITSGCPIKYYERGTFCNTLSSTAKVYFMMTGGVEIAHSTLFPGGSYSNSAWDPNTEWVRQDWTARALSNCAGLLLDTGTFSPCGVGFSMNSGWVRQTGGTFDSTSGWGPFVGDYHAYSEYSYGWGGSPVAYYLEGGEIVGRQIFIGMYYQHNEQPALFYQTGGSAAVTRVCVGAGNQSTATSYSQYLMGGGTLDVGLTKTGYENALIVSAFGGQGSEQSGVFTLTNGTVKTRQLKFGSDMNSLGAITEADLGWRYAEFAMKGGRFELGSGGITNAKNWCRSTTNCFYAIKMSGGTFAPQSEIGAESYQWQVLPSESYFTVETKKQYTQLAPIWGRGNLRKTGYGMLVLSDATRFTGSVKVDEGRLAFATATPEDTDDEGAIIWSGDDIAAKNSLVDGDGVENLTSVDGNHTFVKMDAPSGSTVSIVDKVAISSDAQFAGHKSLKLHYNLLQMEADKNPLNGATNFTVVLVYRSSMGDWCTSENWSCWPYAAAFLGNTSDCVFTHTHTRDDSAISSKPRFAFGAAMKNNVQMMSEMDYDMNNGKAHVTIVSYSNNFVTIVADGFTTNYTVAGATSLKRFNNMAIFLGGNKSTKYTHTNQITKETYIAEMRFYPERAMNEVECYRLGVVLAKKYGVNAHGVVRFSTKCGSLSAPVAPTAPAATAYEWDADDIADAYEDGAEVTAWATKDGNTAIATSTGTGSSHAQRGPSMAKGAINGHAAIKFTSTLKTALGVPSGSNPLLGKTDYTLAVVFRTANTNLTGTGNYAVSANTSGDGLFGMRIHDYKTHDAGFTLHRYGSLLAAWGSGKYTYTLRPMNLNDGEPHVAILSRNGTDGKYELMVDGVRVLSGSSESNALTTDKYSLLFGLSNAKNNWGFYEGELSAARIYLSALTHDEMKTLSEYYADKYGFRSFAHFAVGAAQNPAVGISATNITVAAGATLTLPYDTNDPYTVKSGVSLNGEGHVEGVVRYGAGATLDLNATLPAIDNLQLQSCTVKAAAEPLDGSAISQISGTITIDPVQVMAASKTRNVVLTNVMPDAIAAGATFVIDGADPATLWAEYDATARAIVIRRRFGSVILLW